MAGVRTPERKMKIISFRLMICELAAALSEKKITGIDVCGSA